MVILLAEEACVGQNAYQAFGVIRPVGVLPHVQFINLSNTAIEKYGVQ